VLELTDQERALVIEALNALQKRDGLQVTVPIALLLQKIEGSRRKAEEKQGGGDGTN
jgi:hypothetical protein